MPRLLIIADDLTGANDTGVQLAKHGISVYVAAADVGDSSGPADEYQVLVVDTESRHLPAAEAAEKVGRAVAAGSAAGFTHFYKKTDSSLRGNVGAELEALMRAAKRPLLSFVPAYPQLGRTTRNGFQYVGACLLHESGFGKDPLDPVAESYVPAILERQTRVKTKLLSCRDPIHIENDLAGEWIYVFDASSDDDLKRVGESLRQGGLLNAVAGSAGFAGCLPALLDFERKDVRPLRSEAKMLVVSGSVHETSRRQLARAEAEGFAALTLPAEVLAAADGSQSARAREIIDEVAELYRQQNDVILRSAGDQADAADCLRLGRAAGIGERELRLLIAENLGRVAARVFEKADVKLLSVFGGDTLKGLARALGWAGFVPREEILPGVTISEVAGRGGELLLISKAGGFGQENVLGEIKKRLRSATP